MSEPPESPDSFNINIDLPTGTLFPYLCCLFCSKYFSTPQRLLEHERADEKHKRIVNEKLERMHQFNDYFGNSADREAVERRRRRKLEEQMQQARRTPSTSGLQRYAIDANTGRVCDEGSSRRILVPIVKRKRDEDIASKKETPKRTRIELTLPGFKKSEKPHAVKSSIDISKVKSKEPQPSTSGVSKQKSTSAEKIAKPQPSTSSVSITRTSKQKSTSDEKIVKPQPSTSSTNITLPKKQKPTSEANIAKPQPKPSTSGVSKTSSTKSKVISDENITKPAVKRSIQITETTSKKSKKHEEKSTSAEKARSSEDRFNRRWKYPPVEKPKHSPSKKHVEILDTSWIRTGKLGLTIDKLKARFKPTLPKASIGMTREEFENIEAKPKTNPSMDYYRKQPWFINSQPGTSGLSGKSKTQTSSEQTGATSDASSKHSGQSTEIQRKHPNNQEPTTKTLQSTKSSQETRSKKEKPKADETSTSRSQGSDTTELNQTTNAPTVDEIKLNTSESRLKSYDTSFRDIEDRPPRPLHFRIKMARFMHKIQSRSRQKRRNVTRRRSWP